MRVPFRNYKKKMTDRPETGQNEEPRKDAAQGQPSETDPGAAASDTALTDPEVERLQGELEALRVEHDAVHDKYVRTFAEFDNFRKRSAREKMDLLNTAGSDVLRSVLPVMDDMERAIKHNAEVADIDAVKKGFELIHQKFANILQGQGVKAMQAMGEEFNPDLHDAITQIPAPEPKLKGKVLDVVETGYMIQDKVLRFAKVVVGQ